MKRTFPLKHPVYANYRYAINRTLFLHILVSVWDSGILCNKAVYVFTWNEISRSHL